MSTARLTLRGRLCLITIIALLVTTGASPTACAAARRKVVVLSHGWSGNAKAMQTMSNHLKKAGYESHAISYKGRLLTNDISGYARDLQAFIKKLKLKSSDRLDLVGYSMGGVISRWYAEKLAASQKIVNVVTLCSPHHGTLWGNVTSAAKDAFNIDPDKGTASDVRITSPTVKSLRKDELRTDIRYTALWLPNDKVVIPGKSAMINGALNIMLPKKGIRHTTAPKVSIVLNLVEQALSPRRPAPKGPQGLTTLELFRLGLLDPRDFGELTANEQVKGLNDLAAAKLVWNIKERALLTMLSHAKPGVIKRINRDRFYQKFQGKHDLQRLYTFFGPTAPIECALVKKSKRVATRDVDDKAIRKASGPMLVKLLQLLLKAPVGNQSEKLIIRVLQLRKTQAQTLAQQAGGKNLFYKRIQGKEKKNLREVLPK